jgi:nucleotide-binding universal stress UspA family protein
MNVLVAMMDGSEYGLWALNWVAQLPFVERPRVTVVHVMDNTTLRAPFLPLSVVASEKAYLQEELDRMEARSAQMISGIKQQMAALKLKGIVRKEQGAIAPEILKHVPKRNGLLVVGSKGVDTLNRFMLGSVSTNLVSYATSPVLVVKKDAAPLRRITLATDGSVASAQALEFVLTKFQSNRSAGKRGRMPIHVSVIHVEPSSWNPELMGVGRRSVERSVRKLIEAGFTAEPVYQLGKPAKAIMQIASKQHADLIVMGAKGLGGIARILLGSVSTRVAEYATCSVLVVR